MVLLVKVIPVSDHEDGCHIPRRPRRSCFSPRRRYFAPYITSTPISPLTHLTCVDVRNMCGTAHGSAPRRQGATWLLPWELAQRLDPKGGRATHNLILEPSSTWPAQHGMWAGGSFVRSRNEGSGRWLKTNRRLPIMGMESSRRRSLGVCVSLLKKDDEGGTRNVSSRDRMTWMMETRRHRTTWT